MEYRFFMTPMCPDCGEIKEWIRGKDIKGEIIDATTDEGMQKAQEHDVDSVPTILFFESSKQIAIAKSIDEIKKIIENKSISSY